jgi:hypothetical protein
MQAVTPVQPPSQELLAALEQLQKSNFRKQDGGSFNPDALTPSAKADPIGQLLLRDMSEAESFQKTGPPRRVGSMKDTR